MWGAPACQRDRLSFCRRSLHAHVCVPHEHVRSPSDDQGVQRDPCVSPDSPPTLAHTRVPRRACRNRPWLAPQPSLLRWFELITASWLFSSTARTAAGLGRPAVWTWVPAQGARPRERYGGHRGAGGAQNPDLGLGRTSPLLQQRFPWSAVSHQPHPGSDTEPHALWTPPLPKSPRSFWLAPPATIVKIP